MRRGLFRSARYHFKDLQSNSVGRGLKSGPANRIIPEPKTLAELPEEQRKKVKELAKNSVIRPDDSATLAALKIQGQELGTWRVAQSYCVNDVRLGLRLVLPGGDILEVQDTVPRYCG